jgi:hypothetical protein
MAPGLPLVRIVRWEGRRPVQIELTEAGENLVDRAVPLVLNLGVETVAKGLGLLPHQLQVLMKLRALSQAGKPADVVVTEDEPEEPHG